MSTFASPELERLATRTLELPSEIAAARREYLDLKAAHHEAEGYLKDRAAELLAMGKEGPINGCNAEIREAQLRQRTERERAAAETCELNCRFQDVAVEQLRDELKAIDIYSRLVAARSE